MTSGVFLALLGLAAASFAAATPLPMTSEPLFVGMLMSGLALPALTVAVAALANTAGSVLTYALARVAGNAANGHLPTRAGRWRARIEAWYSRWGLWSLLLSWLPGGDLLVVLAGWAKAPFALVLAILALAKTLRFVVLALVTLGLVG